MATSDVHALQRTGLNDFLFAIVGIEANGMALSVLSILARQGADPWREAERLAKLPRGAAADSLAGDLARMPHSVWNLTDAGLIASKLVDLLPTVRPVAGVVEATNRLVTWPPSLQMITFALAGAVGVAYLVSAFLPIGG